MIYCKGLLINSIFHKNQDILEIQKQMATLDIVSINTQENGIYVITTIIKTLELTEVTVEIHKETFTL